MEAGDDAAPPASACHAAPGERLTYLDNPAGGRRSEGWRGRSHDGRGRTVTNVRVIAKGDRSAMSRPTSIARWVMDGL